MESVAQHGVSIALACRTFQISETCYRYERKLSLPSFNVSLGAVTMLPS